MDMAAKSDEFPLVEARRLTRDLMAPKPLLYWFDFGLHVTLGWAAFVFAYRAPVASPLQAGLIVVASFLLYRSVIFTHELAHLKKGTFRLFRLVWNLTCGFPMMVPSFTYHGVHNDHHKRDLYGTGGDGEYLPFGAGPPVEIILYLLLVFVLPLLFAARFLILTPLSWISPAIRRLTWERLSSLAIDLSYRRGAFSARDDRSWRWQEFAAFLYGWAIVGAVTGGLVGARVLVLWYVLALLIFLYNSFRTLAAHAYRNPGAESMSVAQQFFDSVDVPGNLLLTALWAPVGLRYHATHHLFPNMPYHNLGQAYRRLVAQLGDASPYLAATRRSLPSALGTLWTDARHSRQAA